MVDYRALEDLSHDPKLAEALGNMVIAWAHAENMMFSTFARVTGVGLNMAMESYFSLPTFESRTKFILALVRAWNPKDFDKDAIAKELTKLSKLASTRNGWVHGDWCTNKDKSETVIFNHRVPATHESRKKPVKAHDVSDHTTTVKSRAQKLGALIKWRQLEA